MLMLVGIVCAGCRAGVAAGNGGKGRTGTQHRGAPTSWTRENHGACTLRGRPSHQPIRCARFLGRVRRSGKALWSHTRVVVVVVVVGDPLTLEHPPPMTLVNMHDQVMGIRLSRDMGAFGLYTDEAYLLGRVAECQVVKISQHSSLSFFSLYQADRLTAPVPQGTTD